MDELVSVMQEILDELREINSKLDDIKGYGVDTSIADICSKLDDIKGTGMYNSISDICGNGAWNSLSDVCDKLGDVESALNQLEMTVDMK